MGHFLYFLKKMSYSNFIGIDTSPQQVDFLKESLRKGDYFDIIVLNDVIEHNPKVKIPELLKLMFNVLKPGGKVFIKTPNMGNPFNLRSRYMDFTHEIGFTEHSLYEILCMAGFRKIRVFGAREPCRRGIKVWIMRLMNSSSHIFLRSLFRVLLIPPPEILDKNIIAIGEKP
jgi:SAM-dependent methyltransferase